MRSRAGTSMPRRPQAAERQAAFATQPACHGSSRRIGYRMRAASRLHKRRTRGERFRRCARPRTACIADALAAVERAERGRLVRREAPRFRLRRHDVQWTPARRQHRRKQRQSRRVCPRRRIRLMNCGGRCRRCARPIRPIRSARSKPSERRIHVTRACTVDRPEPVDPSNRQRRNGSAALGKPAATRLAHRAPRASRAKTPPACRPPHATLTSRTSPAASSCRRSGNRSASRARRA